MGNLQATVSKQVAEEFNNVINTVTSSARQTVSLSNVAVNDIRVVIGGVGCPITPNIGGDINLSQAQSSQYILTATNISLITATIKNNLTNALQQFTTQSSTSTQGWLSFAFSAQTAGSYTESDAINDIVNSISGNAAQACSNQVITQNGISLVLCGNVTGSVNIDQDTAVTALESCINKQITNAFISNTVLNNIIQKTDQYFLSQQAGLDSIFYYLAIAAVIIFIIIVIATVYTHHSSQQAKAQRQMQQDRYNSMVVNSIGDDGSGLDNGNGS
ncbi:Hypothetical protein POVR1_LOCUS33 [uncultured virus]|nr:Hypothetical protein POVR1_LOCUS33 [uncultured virus]